MELGYSGLSFPPRIGSKGGWVMTTTSSVDVSHIKESIFIILSTHVGERVEEPTFGSELKNVIFENINETTANFIKYAIKKALGIWEPRIEVTDINVVSDNSSSNQSVLYADISFRVIRTQVESTVSIVLRRGGA